jgi:phage tail-like protein
MPKGFVGNRYDPYKNFKFLLVNQVGKVVLGVSKASALKRTTEVVKHRDGGDNSSDHKSPGRTTYDAITLERGITQDHEFELWANMVHQFAGDPAMDLVNYKQELTLVLLNERNQVAYRYFLHDCWVSEFTTLPDLDANANAVAIETLKLEMEGWERDLSVQEPNEAA